MKFSIFIDYTSMYISTWSMNREMSVSEIEEIVCNNLFKLEDYLNMRVKDSNIELVNAKAYILEGSDFGNPEEKLNNSGIRIIKVRVDEGEFEESALEGKVDYKYEVKEKILKTIEKISKNISQEKKDSIEEKLDKLGIKVKTNQINEISEKSENGEYGNITDDVTTTLSEAVTDGVILVSNNSDFINLYKLAKNRNKLYWVVVNESKDPKIITNSDKCFNINEIRKGVKNVKTPIKDIKFNDISVDNIKESVEKEVLVKEVVEANSIDSINLLDMMNTEIIDTEIVDLKEEKILNKRIELYENKKLIQSYSLDKKNLNIGKSNLNKNIMKDIDLSNLELKDEIAINYGNIYVVGKKIIFAINPKCTSQTTYKNEIIKAGKQIQLELNEFVNLGKSKEIELVYKE